MVTLQRVKNDNRGFSLVELMVVVAIIGVLAAIAIPNVTKYIAKARQTEAKTQLSSIFTSEKAFYAEYSTYDDRFAVIAYSPEGELRYNAGFVGGGNEAGTTNGYNSTPPNTFTNTWTYCGSALATLTNGCMILAGANNAAPATTVPASTSTAGGTTGAATTAAATFVASATAAVYVPSSGTVTADEWSINDSKVLANFQNGIN